MTESTCFVSIPRTNAESLARICALAVFSSNDAVAALDTVAESAVAGVLLLQPDQRRLPTASRVIPPVFRILPSQWLWLGPTYGWPGGRAIELRGVSGSSTIV